MKSKKSTLLIWVQLIIALVVIAWLSYDFFQTLISGVTYKIRLNDTLDIREYPFVFIITVGFKLLVYWFFIRLLIESWNNLKASKQKGK